MTGLAPDDIHIPGRWHFEVVTADMMAVYRINDIVHTGTTQYQAVHILDTGAFWP